MINSFFAFSRNLVTAAALFLAALNMAFSLGTKPAVLGVPPPIVPQGFGVEIHFTVADPAEIKHFSQVGFGFARMDMTWGDVEKTRGVYDFHDFDTLTNTLSGVRCRTLYILDYYNKMYENGEAPRTPEGRAAFSRFAAAAAAHFRGRGVIWEIWNEPNGTYWAPEPNTNDYALLAVAVARAIHTADPDACVIAPAVSEIPMEFLQQVFHHGLLRYINAVSVHPYRGKYPETVAPDYLAIRKLIASCTAPGHQPVPIICSEWGYPSNPNWGNVIGQAPPITEDIQGRYLLREWLCNLALGVNLTDWYDWHEDGTDPKDPEYSFGTIHQDGRPKPAFLLAKSLVHNLSGYRFVHRLIPSTPDDWRLLFCKGTDLAVVAWTTRTTAPDSAQTPQVQFIEKSDLQYKPLLGICSAQYTSAPLVATPSTPAQLPVTVINFSGAPTNASVVVGDEAHTLRLLAYQEQVTTFALTGNIASTHDVSLPVHVIINGKIVTGLPPVTIATVSNLDLRVEPMAKGRQIHIDALGAPFTGVIRISTAGKTTAVPLRLDAFTSQVIYQDTDPSAETSMVAIDTAGRRVAVMQPAHFQALAFPQALEDKAPFVITAETNGTTLTTPALVVPTGVQIPAAIAIAMHDQPTGKWELKPASELRIPKGARELVLWVRANNSLAIIRSQYTDSTGQVFQQTLNWINWKGWKLVHIPLAGIAPPTAFGGANDDIAHPPLHWEVVFMADAFRPNSEPDILFAAPYYELP